MISTVDIKLKFCLIQNLIYCHQKRYVIGCYYVWWIFWKKVFIAQWWFAQWRRKCVVITISSPPEHLELFSLEGCVSISDHLAEFRPYNLHCAKIVRIWSYSGPHFSISPYSIRMWENTDDNSEHGHFLRSAR